MFCDRNKNSAISVANFVVTDGHVIRPNMLFYSSHFEKV